VNKIDVQLGYMADTVDVVEY